MYSRAYLDCFQSQAVQLRALLTFDNRRQIGLLTKLLQTTILCGPILGYILVNWKTPGDEVLEMLKISLQEIQNESCQIIVTDQGA